MMKKIVVLSLAAIVPFLECSLAYARTEVDCRGARTSALLYCDMQKVCYDTVEQCVDNYCAPELEASLKCDEEASKAGEELERCLDRHSYEECLPLSDRFHALVEACEPLDQKYIACLQEYQPICEERIAEGGFWINYNECYESTKHNIRKISDWFPQCFKGLMQPPSPDLVDCDLLRATF